jgi:hypothetical protein
MGGAADMRERAAVLLDDYARDAASQGDAGESGSLEQLAGFVRELPLSPEPQSHPIDTDAPDRRRGAAGVERAAAAPAEGLSTEDAETLRGAGWRLDGHVWRDPLGNGFVEDGINLDLLRETAAAIRAKAPVAAHGEPGKVTGGDHAATGSSSVAEQQGAAQGERCERVYSIGDPKWVGCMTHAEPDSTCPIWKMRRAPEAQSAPLPKPSRVEVGQRWRCAGWGDLEVFATGDVALDGRDVRLRVALDPGGAEVHRAESRLMLTSDRWNFLGPAGSRRRAAGAPEKGEAAGRMTPADMANALQCDEPAEEPSEPTARDAVAGMLLRHDWDTTAGALVHGEITPDEAIERINSVDIGPGERACIAALDALDRCELHGARDYSGIAAVNQRLRRERDEAHAEASALREQLDRLRRKSALRKDWNRCPRCKSLVDSDDVHDGSEVRCRGCNITLVCTSCTDGTWTLVEAEDQDAPPVPRIEVRDGGEVVVGAPLTPNDCHERTAGGLMCMLHIGSEHVAVHEPDADGVAEVIARWPIEPAQEPVSVGVDIGTGPAKFATTVLVREPGGELRALATFEGPDAEAQAREYVKNLPADPTQEPQCGGPKEACAQPGRDECGAPDDGLPDVDLAVEVGPSALHDGSWNVTLESQEHGALVTRFYGFKAEERARAYARLVVAIGDPGADTVFNVNHKTWLTFPKNADARKVLATVAELLGVTVTPAGDEDRDIVRTATPEELEAEAMRRAVAGERGSGWLWGCAAGIREGERRARSALNVVALEEASRALGVEEGKALVRVELDELRDEVRTLKGEIERRRAKLDELDAEWQRVTGCASPGAFRAADFGSAVTDADVETLARGARYGADKAAALEREKARAAAQGLVDGWGAEARQYRERVSAPGADGRLDTMSASSTAAAVCVDRCANDLRAAFGLTPGSGPDGGEREGRTADVRASGVLGEVAAERAAQDAQWGGPEHDDEHGAGDWLHFISVKTRKAAGEDSPRRRFIQIAALAVAAVESMDRLAASAAANSLVSGDINAAPWRSAAQRFMVDRSGNRNHFQEHDARPKLGAGQVWRDRGNFRVTMRRRADISAGFNLDAVYDTWVFLQFNAGESAPYGWMLDGYVPPEPGGGERDDVKVSVRPDGWLGLRPAAQQKEAPVSSATSDVGDEAARLAGLALSEPDPESDCLCCGSSMSRPEPELEPTPLCNLCAQTVVVALAAEVQRRGGAGPAPEVEAQDAEKATAAHESGRRTPSAHGGRVPETMQQPAPDVNAAPPDREALGREVHDIWACRGEGAEHWEHRTEQSRELLRLAGERLFAMGERHGRACVMRWVRRLDASLREARRDRDELGKRERAWRAGKARAQELLTEWEAKLLNSMRLRDASQTGSLTWAARHSSACIRRACMLELAAAFEVEMPGGAAAHAEPEPIDAGIPRATALRLAEDWATAASGKRAAASAYRETENEWAAHLDDGEARGLQLAANELRVALGLEPGSRPDPGEARRSFARAIVGRLIGRRRVDAEDERAATSQINASYNCGRKDALTVAIEMICEAAGLEPVEGPGGLDRGGMRSDDSPQCCGEWLSGSGGHRMFGGGCDRPVLFRDGGADGGVYFCEKHVEQLDPEDRERIGATDLEPDPKRCATCDGRGTPEPTAQDGSAVAQADVSDPRSS